MSHVDDGTLHAYLDGELPAAERARLEAHVAECATCRDRLTEERGLIERAGHLLALAELPAGHSHRPPQLTVQPRRARRRFIVPGVWAASIAMAFLAGWLLRPTPQFRRTSGGSDTMPVAAVPAADSAPSAMARDAVSRLARSAPAARRRDTHQASSDSSAAVALGAAETRVDSPAYAAPVRQAVAPEAAGKVAAPALRGAAPTPIPPATVAVAPPAPQLQRLEVTSPAAPRPIGTTWTVIAPEPARKVLGAEVARIPGLPVRDILQNPLAPGEVMVEQEVAEGTVIQLFQSRLDSALQGFSNLPANAVEAGTPLQKTVGRLQVRISGPLTADSLLKLLERVR